MQSLQTKTTAAPLSNENEDNAECGLVAGYMIFATDIQWQLISKVWTKQFREKNDTEFKLLVSNFSVLLVMHL